MKRALLPVVHFAIKKAKRSRFLQHLFESPIVETDMPKMGSFKDSFGHEIVLRQGIRELIRPHWREIYSRPPLEKEWYRKKMRENAMIDTEKILSVLATRGLSIQGKRVLEIGANKGAASYAYSERGAAHVTGSDYSGYQVDADALEGGDLATPDSVNSFYSDFREILKQRYAVKGEVVFADDDICNTSLPKQSFDLMFSSQVLEHLSEPQKAFDGMYSLLKPGGYMVHEYNPFFSLNGGHSLCTLDMLWGHVRLNESDLEKYLLEFRPDEAERALAFFTKGINRMTLGDIRSHLEVAGFDDISIIPLPKEQHMRMVTAEIFAQARNLYPKLELMDLCSPRVFLIARRKE
jgi:SAM-dependent methyltransferase